MRQSGLCSAPVKVQQLLRADHGQPFQHSAAARGEAAADEVTDAAIVAIDEAATAVTDAAAARSS